MGISGALSNMGGREFGLAGRFIVGAFDKSGYDPDKHEEIEYKCLDCKGKFFVEKKPSAFVDDFHEPFTITFFREKKFVGAMMPQVVFLNGFRVGIVKNGQAIRFTTNKIKNVLVVTDYNGMAFPDYLSFEAFEGGSKNIRFAFTFGD
jgi:hypothetical protein